MIDILCADVKFNNFQHLLSSISYHPHLLSNKYADIFLDGLLFTALAHELSLFLYSSLSSITAT